MATLVLNTVGTMLGGPVGGAIGSLLGQSIDQQLFGPGARHGPRLGDLSVQTSAYGSAIPQIFGRMRVAGTIIWATDLQEASDTESTKNQPDAVTYSYSASFAVALSSRPIGDIGRIWADGKLIRTSNGVFTVKTAFRVQTGSEQQQLDPLIASVEGMDSTPAYRGLALAIFENLQLADFGNRIPFLTFEVIADTAAVSAGSLLRQVSGGVIASDDANAVIGYAAHGRTMSSAVDQFVQVLGIDLFDDGSSLSSPGLEVTAVDQRQAGCGADQKMRPAIERSQDAAANVPTALSLSYYDVDRDYQAGLARASIDAMLPSTQQVELPAVLEAGSAKALAQSALARRWAERDKLTLRLPPAYLSLRPGALIQLSAEVGLWRIQAVLVDSLAVVVDLRPVYATAIDLVAADSGRVLQSPPIVAEPTKLSLVELPDDGTGSADAPVVAVAASGGSTWRAVPLAIEAGEASFTVQSSRRAGVTGVAVGILPKGPAELFDLRNSVDVRLNDPTAWLESRDDDALAAGANLAMLGRELTQFGDALPLGDGAFRLSRLLRGRRGTEWAMAGHGAGDEFVLVDASRLLILPLTRAQVGASVRVTPMGLADSGAAPVQISVSGEAMRPPAPSHVRTWFDAAGNLNCTWVRRSNLGWDWLDGVDAPLGCASERYSVSLQGSTSSIQIETASPEAQFTADQVNALGDPALNLVIAQIGDFAVSRPAVVPISTI